MATVRMQGTEFSLSVLPLSLLSSTQWAKTEIKIENTYVSYKDVGKIFLTSELEEWLFCMFRLLAGGYAKEYSLSFEKAGIAVDMYPYVTANRETTREERRENDCIMAIRLLMRSKDKKQFLGGVYSLLMHREDIRAFAIALKTEWDKVFAKRVHGRGKYLFAGVSPVGYHGCNYWYLDESGKVKAGDYVWVQMGRHNTRQLVYVDSVRRFNDENAPYSPAKVRRVQGIATAEEIQKILSNSVVK